MVQSSGDKAWTNSSCLLAQGAARVSLRLSIQMPEILASGNANKLTDGREQRASDLAWKQVNEFAQRHGCLPEVSDVIVGVEGPVLH